MQHYSDFSLKHHNTFHIDARADHFFIFDSSDELKEWLLTNPLNDSRPTLVMGGGSNLLFADDFPGRIIYPRFKGLEIVGREGDDVLVRVAAGEEWDSCVEQTVNMGLGGIENLSLIPGHVGAVPVQNIGAYGVEIQNVVESVEGYYLADGKPFCFSQKACAFNYRYSVFKGPLRNKTVVTHVVLRLCRKPVFQLKYGSVREAVEGLGPVNLKNIRKAIVGIREAKLPNPEELGNAGSFFKNPVVPMAQYEALKARWPELPGYPVSENNSMKVPAGWLIEHTGWKGKSLGKAGVHQHQALVLVNRGGASGQDLVRLAQSIEHNIRKTFNIQLEREVNVLPEPR